jgi:hypothetical protein
MEERLELALQKYLPVILVNWDYSTMGRMEEEIKNLAAALSELITEEIDRRVAGEMRYHEHSYYHQNSYDPY